ncbi:OMPdecase-domain-containing protein [Pleurostoma richardsiae]|uniref:OMPdecase-domain-containing protein n=1 Tax=Pleurostoma richardsiae TaxID=41990 RepID=A0AA38VE33_9PEZI|nr:OMPdecase-domain-containing protein [Pleurostoma richardsiae]
MDEPQVKRGDSSEEQSPAKEDNTSRPPPRKRRRIVISCTECHRRKQKCDRKLPCTNCVSRNKQDACHYETGAPTAKDLRKGSSDSPTGPKRGPDDSLPQKVVNFGYSQTGASTLGFLKKIDGANPEEPLSRLAMGGNEQGDQFGTRERYKSLIRQLPGRIYIEKLVDIYFVDFNWQYYGVEKDYFDKQLEEWYNLPFNLLNTAGPQALSPDLRAFPAVLFQIVATSLLSLPAGSDPLFDNLKYAGTMSWDDLAMDYSESGMSILSLLGKRHMSMTTVIAGFLRAAFLKYTGLVTEAWHAIGSAIRDAQEVGIHRDSLDPKPKSDDAEAVLENMWQIQQRRKMWMILMGWDLHTGIVLGRPTSIDGSVNYTLPIDAPLPKDRRKSPIRPRTDDDPPTPLTRALWAYEMMRPLHDILELEKEGPCPKNFDRVDKVHQGLLDLEARTPAYFRLENPDTRFDDLPECYWIPFVRATLPQIVSFNYMALHRPYIFTRAHSRTEALKSSLAMLEAQRKHFSTINPQQYKTFSLFFGTFDAIVLMASIYILFPKEHPELVTSACQHFRWAVERFETMSERNSLAKAALGVLQAIYIRLKKSLGLGFVNAKQCLPANNCTAPSVATETPASSAAENATPRFDGSTVAGTSSLSRASASHQSSMSASSDVYSSLPSSVGPADPAAAALDAGGSNAEWALPTDFDWGSIQPIYALGDVAYNELSGIRDDAALQQGGWDATAGAETPLMSEIGGAGGAMPYQFEGDFGNDTVWNLFNLFSQYNPN